MSNSIKKNEKSLEELAEKDVQGIIREELSEEEKQKIVEKYDSEAIPPIHVECYRRTGESAWGQP